MKRLSVGYFLIGLLIVGAIAKPTLDDTADEDAEGEDMQSDDDYVYDDDENSGQDRSAQDDTPPAILQQVDYSIRKKIGDDVTLTCDVKNIGKLNVIMWYNQSTLIYQQQIRTTKDERVSVNGTNLMIHNVQPYDASLYRCVVLPTRLTLNVTLEVSEGRKTAILHRGRDVTEQTLTFKQGDRIELQCVGNANPKPTIKWFTAGKRAMDVAGINIDSNDASLIIENPDHSHNLVLQCLADNGNADHATVQLAIRHKPQVTNHRRYFNTEIGSDGHLFCVYTADPQGNTQWLYKGEALKNGSKYHHTTEILNNKFHMHLLIKNVQEADIGLYNCEVKNSMGKDVGEVNLVLVPEPGQLTKVETTNQETRLEWLVHSKMPLSEVTLSYQAVGSNKWSSEKPSIVERHNVNGSGSSEHSGVWRIEHHLSLEAGKWHARMKTRNSLGWSKFSTQETIEVPAKLEEDVDMQFADLTGGKANSASMGASSLALPIVLLTSAILAAIQRT